MSLKGWILTALAAVALYAGAFIHGKFQERSVNAPAVARAQAAYDALEGEKKTLDRKVESYDLKEAVWALKLRDSERKRQDLAKKVERIPVLLGLDKKGKAIVRYKSTEETTSTTSSETDHAADAVAMSRTETAKTEASKLKADRQITHLGYLGLGWWADHWTAWDRVQAGAPGLALGIQVPVIRTLVTGRKVFNGTQDAQVEAGWTW